MRYSNYLKKINDALVRHKETVDKLVFLYSSEIKGHKEQLAKMKGIYAESYIEQYAANWKPEAHYDDAIKKSSEKAVLEVELYLSKIKKEMDKYFDSPVQSDFANKINAISMTGLGLKDREFALLVESASNYMELRLIQHLAESRTKPSTVSSINERGQTETKEVEVKNPYHIELPDIDYLYRVYNDFAGSAKTMAKYYCGENAELKEYLGAVSEYAPITAGNYFKGHSLNNFTDAMEKANGCLPENKVKKELTESEKKLIDTMIDSRYPALAENKVKALAEADDDIRELLLLDERYAKFIEESEE